MMYRSLSNLFSSSSSSEEDRLPQPAPASSPPADHNDDAPPRKEQRKFTRFTLQHQTRPSAWLRYVLFGLTVALTVFLVVQALSSLPLRFGKESAPVSSSLLLFSSETQNFVAFGKKRDASRSGHSAVPLPTTASTLDDDPTTENSFVGGLRRLLSEALIEFQYGTAPTPSRSRLKTVTVPKEASQSNISPSQNDTMFPTAYTEERIVLVSDQRRLLEKLSSEVVDTIPDFLERASRVPWGEPSSEVHNEWFPAKKVYRSDTTDLEQIHGGSLLYAYLRIMDWPANLNTNFPFKLCKNERNGCDAKMALHHTLNFRERYKPWMVTPSLPRVNARGGIFHHGFSPSLVSMQSRKEDESVAQADESSSGHAIVWVRPALREGIDDIFEIRTIINVLDRAVAASLLRSNGRVGKFNAVLDAKDLSWSTMPSVACIKATLTMLQDHYVDRLGVVLLANMSAVAEFILQIVRPLITPDVRKKIVILPSRDTERRLEILSTVLGVDNVPTWLGGIDTYTFDVDEFYGNENAVWGSDEEALEYLQTMPYHS